jgi:ADP-ribosylglycohydrolase
VRRFLATGELRAAGGSSIGAAMRALPFGWATSVAATEHRRELTIRLSRTTHGAPEAIISAGVVAGMAAWAIEQHPIAPWSRPESAKQNAWHGGTCCVLLSCGRSSRRLMELGSRPRTSWRLTR